MLKKLLLLACLLPCGLLLADDAVVSAAATKEGPIPAGKVFYPASDSTAVAGLSSKPTAVSTAGTTFVYLLFLASLGYTAYLFWKRRATPTATVKSSQTVEILSTRPLGSRQYLVVAKYGQEQLLLGVGPGFITRLSSDKDSSCDTSSHS